MKPLVARALPIVFVLGLFAVAPAGAAGTYPVITAFSPQVAAPGATITIQGSGFAQNGCQSFFGTTAPPTVIFTPLDGSPATQAIPNATDPTQCSDSQVIVRAPNFTSAAQISLIANPQQPNGSMTNDPGQGIDPLLTAPIQVQPTPLTGMVASSVTITGENLMPGTAVPGSLVMHLDTGPTPYRCAASECTDLTPTGWTPSGISADPGQTSGEVTGSFLVAWDRRQPNNTQKQVRESFDGGAYEFRPPAFPDTVVVGAGVGLAAVFRGSNLGTAPHGTVAFSDNAPVRWKSKSSGEFSATIPNGVPPLGKATITVDGWNGSFTVPINVTPLIQTGPIVVTGGDHVDIAGTTFGTAPGNMLIGSKYVNTITEWHDTRVTFFVLEDQPSGRLQLTRPPETPGLAEGKQVTVVPRLVQISVDDVRVDQEISIDGHSLGSQPGTLLIGSQRAPVSLWSLRNIVFRVPNLTPGAYPITVTTSGGAVANGPTLHVVGGSSAPASPGAQGTTNCGLHSTFVKPLHPASPVQVTLEAQRHTAAPGAEVPVIVTVRLDGQPVQGATVQLTMRCSHGGGYRFTPATGTTDKDGHFRATVRVSDAAGDDIIRAETGVFNDEDHVLVSGAQPNGRWLSDVGLVLPAGAVGAVIGIGFAVIRRRLPRRRPRARAK